ncbi:response regulator receiver protein [Colletotrichum orchidophilum]|uniref:Response regulator receiver protein n=1 Tax=Colletotrichum orchidophilum TaxID=1209926 RepID=A0A1G4BEE7_9PEZI|nr:response regulator receiver protein [Colletotrichum orchidophilum]OHE99705.1 response regulator receiver protein [Colletotrichum orchidophilum]
MAFPSNESLQENESRLMEGLGTKQSDLSSSAQTDYHITATSKPPPINILLAEPNHGWKKIIAKQMDRLGHKYDLTGNGQEAFEAYKKGHQTYQCILTSPSMPVLDGLHSTRLIRAFETENNLKPCYIVVMTAGGSMGRDMDRTRRLGFDKILKKPFKMEILESHLVDLGLVSKEQTEAR